MGDCPDEAPTLARLHDQKYFTVNLQRSPAFTHPAGAGPPCRRGAGATVADTLVDRPGRPHAGGRAPASAMKAACPATTGRVFSRPAANSTEHRLASRAGDLPGPVAAAAVPACSGRLPGRGARVSTFASSTDAAGIGGSQEGPGDLGRAFELVQEALSKAEANVERVPHLPSARRRREVSLELLRQHHLPDLYPPR